MGYIYTSVFLPTFDFDVINFGAARQEAGTPRKPETKSRMLLDDSADFICAIRQVTAMPLWEMFGSIA